MLRYKSSFPAQTCFCHSVSLPLFEIHYWCAVCEFASFVSLYLYIACAADSLCDMNHQIDDVSIFATERVV